MKRLLLAGLPYLLFLLLAAVSWQRWIEPYVDSGRELMVPRRLAEGERLYRDVRFYHGPLGPYLAAGVEALAGRSLPARILLAGAIALLHLEALRRLATRLLGLVRGALASSLAVAVAFFLRPGGCHLFPFSLDTALAVASILWALALGSGREAPRRDTATGLCLLGALLARADMGVAAIVSFSLEARRGRRLWRLALLPSAAAAAVYAVLSLGTPVRTLRSEGWLALLGPPGAFRRIYAAYAGLDQPALRLAELALAATLLLLTAALLLAAAFAASRSGRAAGRAIELGALALLAAAALLALRPPAHLAETFGLLPPLVRVVPPLLVAAAAARLLARLAGRVAEGLFGRVPDAVLYVAGFFGARVLLAAGYVGPYSAFFLPLATVVAGAGLFHGADRLAARVEKSSASPSLPRLFAAALLLFALFRTASLTLLFRHPAWSRVETPAGTLYLTEPVAGATRLALEDLPKRSRDGAAVGFPETGFFNYVLGLESPLPQEQFFPGHLDAAAEREAIRTLLESPPDAILYANVLAVGHGQAAFGRDYLTELDRAVRSHFRPAASYGPGAGPGARIGDPGFFVEIRTRREAAP